jgi:hypothetical protein
VPRRVRSSLRWAPVAFEIIQAMSTALAFVRLGSAQQGRPFDAAYVGGGSGNAPMTARKLFPALLRVRTQPISFPAPPPLTRGTGRAQPVLDTHRRSMKAVRGR